MGELHRAGTESGSETSEPAAETKQVAQAEHEPTSDTAVSQYEDDAAIEARLDEAGLPTRAEARAAALRPDADDYDEDGFDPESDAAIEARLDEADLPTRAESRELRTPHEAAESVGPTSEEKARLHEIYLDWRNENSTEREQGSTVVRDKPDRSPDGTRDFPPTGEQLVEIEDQKASRAERARKEFLSKENLDDAFDATDKWAKTGQDLFNRLPTGQHVEVPAQEQAITMMPHHEVDSGSVATAGLALGIIGAEFFRWGRRKVEHRRGRHRAGD